MTMLLQLAFLFCVGSCLGWVLEVFFRRFFSRANPEHRWINPGFCTGPYLPIYGTGLCVLYGLSSCEQYLPFDDPVLSRLVLFLLIAVFMTAIEFVTGMICLKAANLRLWDYREKRGNIEGVICPQFSLIWSLMGAGYYFCVHPYILEALAWLAKNLAFSFFIGAFFGVFAVDVVQSSQIILKIRRFAVDNHIVVLHENLMLQIRRLREEANLKYDFFHPFRTEGTLTEHMKELRSLIDEKTAFLKRRKAVEEEP